MLTYSRSLRSLTKTCSIPTMFWRRDGIHCIHLQSLVFALGVSGLGEDVSWCFSLRSSRRMSIEGLRCCKR